MTATGRLPAAVLYFGRVLHQRLMPFRHRFSYRVFSLYLDIDRLAEIDRQSPLFSCNRFGIFSFHECDHGARDGTKLRSWVEGHLHAGNTDLAGGRIMLLCFPRLFGYVFNPLSIFYCHDAGGRLRAILYEVKNTFGQQHCYMLPVTGDGDVVQTIEKRFYVSPFIGMEATYAFRLTPPGERLSIMIRQSVPAGDLLIAAQSGRRADFNSAQLLWALLAYPLMSLKVTGAIHWEAMRLWIKGARYHRRPAPPDAEITFAPAQKP